MAVFQEQGPDGCSFTVRPNCALSWRATKYLVVFFACCFGAVGCYFASIGAWLVLPFAGLELVVLAAGFYVSALTGHSREVILVDGPVVRVMRGSRRLDEVARFPANWTRVQLWRDPRGWYPSRLWLRCHGRRLEIATKVVEAERDELAQGLDDWLGIARPRAGNVADEVLGPGLAPRTTRAPKANGARAFFGDGVAVGADSRVSSRDKAARSARSEF